MNKRICYIFVFALILKLLLALFIPVTLDEYYYFVWGKYPSLSYFDHPPMVGWLMVLSQPLKWIHEGAIRWPFILLSHATLLVWDQILKHRVSEKRRLQFWWTGLLNPLWGWGVFIATPDIPLVFFWSVALYFCGQVLVSNQWRNYLGLGLSLGLGFLSKYHVALFLPSLLIMLWQQNQLKKLLSVKTLVSVALALVVCSPVFIWNALNDWVSIEFQWNHGMNFKYWKWTLPLDYFFGQLFIIFPTFLLFIFNKKEKWKNDWLLPFVVFPFAFFLYSSFRGKVEANWVIMALPAVFALSCLYSSPKQWKIAFRTVYLWSALFIAAVGLILFKDSIPSDKIKIFETDKYEDVLPLMDPDKRYFAYSYQMAGFLSFKTDRLICRFPAYGRPDHFQFIEECRDFSSDFIYVSQTRGQRKRKFYDRVPGLKRGRELPINDYFLFVEVLAP